MKRAPQGLVLIPQFWHKTDPASSHDAIPRARTRRPSMSPRHPTRLPGLPAWLPAGLLLVTLILSARVAQAGMIGAGAGSGPRSVVIGDVNEDGYSDLVWGNYQDSTVCVALGRGNGRFKPKVSYACGSIVFGIALADLNGDNHLDVVDCCASVNRVQVRFGAGDGTLGARTDYAVNVPMNVVARDLNEDGQPDLAIASQSAPYLKIMMATGPGTYGPLVEYPGASGIDLAVGDLNNDGDLDIVTGNASSNGVNVYLSTGGPGLYGAPVTYSTQGGGTSVLLADFNHDGALDIAAASSGFTCLNVRLGIGNGTFAANTVYPLDASPFSASSGDFNGDGNPDIAVGVYDANEVSVFLGTGSGTFQPKVDYPSGVNPMRIAIGQLDGDANVDLAVAAWGSNSICTLSGNGNGSFQVPSGPVYVWAPASGDAFVSGNWLPARTASSTSDILVFNRGGAVTVTGIPNATIGQMVFSGGTEASFSALSGPTTLNVGGGTGDDAVIEEGSKSVLASSSLPVSVNLLAGAHATVYGDIEIRGGNNKFQAIDSNGILFQSTGRAIIGPGSSSTPFGDGTGASGLNSVLFHYGSAFIAQTVVAVFGASAPNAVVAFLPGSRFRMDVAFTPAASGRTYADFEYNVPGGNTTITGTNPFQVDSLIVTQGTFTVAMTGPVTIRGNIVVPTCSGPSLLRFLPATPATYKLGGASRQSAYSTAVSGCIGNVLRMYASPNVTWNVDNPAGVFLGQPWRTSSNFNFTHGNITLGGWQLVTDSTSAVTGASQSTGWIDSPQTRRVTANGPVHFDVGDSANYLPMDVDMHAVTGPGYVLGGTIAWDNYDIARAQLDLAHLVHRTWYVSPSNDFGNVLAPTYFGDLDATFLFRPSDVDPGSDPLQFEMRQYFSNAVPWRATTPGIRTATSTQALGMTAAVLDSFSTLSCGQPITPSVSVFNASGAEGNGPPSPQPVLEASYAFIADQEVGELAAPFLAKSSSRRPPAIAARAAQVQTTGSLSFRVRLSQPAVVPISVDYQTVDGTATVADGDYTPTSGTLNIAAGDSALDIVIPLGTDTTPERNETFGVTLSNATNATIGSAAATGTILDDDDLVAPTAQVTSPNGGEVIYQNQQVNLQWTASDNVAVSGVDIQLVNGKSVTTLAADYPNTGSYPWTASGPASTMMKFRVVAHDDPGHTTTDDSDANWELSGDVVGVENGLPLAFALPPPAPNPSPDGLNLIAFAVPHEAYVRLTVHDVRGRTLAKLADGVVPAGHYVRTWDSTPVAAGVYFVRFEAPGFRADQRLVVIR